MTFEQIRQQTSEQSRQHKRSKSCISTPNSKHPRTAKMAPPTAPTFHTFDDLHRQLNVCNTKLLVYQQPHQHFHPLINDTISNHSLPLAGVAKRAVISRFKAEDEAGVCGPPFRSYSDLVNQSLVPCYSKILDD